MDREFPSAVPEVPVASVPDAIAYYENSLGFTSQGGSNNGFGQVLKGGCRIFLTDPAFRTGYGDRNIQGPVVVWLNLNSRKEVNELHETWRTAGARILFEPASMPWHLHEFAALDLDGNLLRVFYDFAWELCDHGGAQA